MSKIELNDAQKTAAVDAIHGYAKAFGKVTKALGSVSDWLVKLAKEAGAMGGDDVTKTIECFKALTKHAETVFKEENTVDGKKAPTIADLLPTWQTNKSEIVRAWKAGIDVRDHDTHYAVNEARKEAEAAKPEAKRTTGGAAGDKAGEKVPVSAATGKELDRIHAAIKRMVKTQPQLEAATAAILKTCADSLDELVQMEQEADVKSRKAA